MQLDKLPEAAGVVVVDRLGVSKGLHDGTGGAEQQQGDRRVVSDVPAPDRQSDSPALQQRLLHV